MIMKHDRLAAVLTAAVLSSCIGVPADSPADDPEGGTTAVANDYLEEAVWSVDGSRLAATWTQEDGSRLVGLFGPYRDEPPEPGTGLPLADGQAGWGSWSPDGLWVAYARGDEGARDIYRTRPDGSGAERLTSDPADDYDPAYSPDGRSLLFVSTRDGGTPRLYLMGADGRDPRLLADLGGAVRRPQWSPDGSRFAVQVTEGGDQVVYVVSASGAGFGRLATGLLPAWFPDGRRVTFTENDSLFWRPSEGGLRRFLVADARAGRVSPDGRWLAFVRGQPPRASLYLLDLENETETRITP
jgi:Tol biopolymer transport system component